MSSYENERRSRLGSVTLKAINDAVRERVTAMEQRQGRLEAEILVRVKRRLDALTAEDVAAAFDDKRYRALCLRLDVFGTSLLKLTERIEAVELAGDGPAEAHARAKHLAE